MSGRPGAFACAQAIAERNPLRYAAYCYDSHSGLYYLQRRSYDPLTRQFLARDPLRADGDASPYQYCGGSPVAATDPLGLYMAQGSGAGGGDNKNPTTLKHLYALYELRTLKAWYAATYVQQPAKPRFKAVRMVAEAGINVSLGVNIRDDLNDFGNWVGARVGEAFGEAMTGGAYHSRYENGPGMGTQFSGTANLAGDLGEGQLRVAPYQMAFWGPAAGAASRGAAGAATTAARGRVFYTGAGRATAEAAKDYAGKHGLDTIHDMWYGSALDRYGGLLPGRVQRRAWRIASGSYARGATGTVHVIQTPTLSIPNTSTWKQVEYGYVADNPIRWYVWNPTGGVAPLP